MEAVAVKFEVRLASEEDEVMRIWCVVLCDTHDNHLEHSFNGQVAEEETEMKFPGTKQCLGCLQCIWYLIRPVADQFL